MSATTSKHDLLAAAYAAFNRRDIDAILALMCPDVDWPNGMEGGRLYGRDQVREYWERQWSLLDPRVNPIRITEDEAGNSVVEVHQLVRDLDGHVLVDHTIQHVYSINGGLIERMEIRDAEQAPAAE